MYLAKDHRYGMDYFVFSRTDPRKDGYAGKVIENVTLDFHADIDIWPDGQPTPEPQLGRDPTNRTHYKVFKSPHELQDAGFEFVTPNTPVEVYSWRAYRRMFPVPKDLAESLGQDEWSQYLDEIDEATKLLRQKDTEPEPPVGSDRDKIAEWVAKRHLGTDGSIRQVVYLPSGAPANEIRLLEVNERIARSEEVPEPLDFGIEIAGRAIKVFVADVTKAQLEKLKADPSFLPKGWAWGGERVWGLRA